MSMPLDLDTILSEFSEKDTAWTLRDRKSGQYVTIPHERYPGRHIFHFFMSAQDAKDLLSEIVVENPRLGGRDIYPEELKLKTALRSLAAEDPLNGFVVHTPNEVFEFLEPKVG